MRRRERELKQLTKMIRLLIIILDGQNSQKEKATEAQRRNLASKMIRCDAKNGEIDL